MESTIQDNSDLDQPPHHASWKRKTSDLPKFCLRSRQRLRNLLLARRCVSAQLQCPRRHIPEPSMSSSAIDPSHLGAGFNR
jgi:hypothetical protein